MSSVVIANGGYQRSPLKGYTEEEEYRELQKLVQLQESIRSGNHPTFKPKVPATAATAATIRPVIDTPVNGSLPKGFQALSIENNQNAEPRNTSPIGTQQATHDPTVNEINGQGPPPVTKAVSKKKGQGGAIKAASTLPKKNIQNSEKNNNSLPKSKTTSVQAFKPVDSIFSQYPHLKSKIIDKETLDKQYARSKLDHQRGLLHGKIQQQLESTTLDRLREIELYMEPGIDFDNIYQKAIDLANIAYGITTVIKDHNTPSTPNKPSVDEQSHREQPTSTQSLTNQQHFTLTTSRPRSSNSESNDEAYSPPPVISYEVFGEKRRASLVSQGKPKNDVQENQKEQGLSQDESLRIPIQPPVNLSTVSPLRDHAIAILASQSIGITNSIEPVILQTLRNINGRPTSPVAITTSQIERNMQTPFVAPQPIRPAESVPLERVVAEQEMNGTNNVRGEEYIAPIKTGESGLPQDDRTTALNGLSQANLPLSLQASRRRDPYAPSPVVTIHRSSPLPDSTSHRGHDYHSRVRDVHLHSPEEQHHPDYVVEYVPMLVPRREALYRKQYAHMRDRPVYVDEYGRPVTSRSYIEEYDRYPRRVVYDTDREPAPVRKIYVDERGRQVVQQVYSDYPRARPISPRLSLQYVRLREDQVVQPEAETSRTRNVDQNPSSPLRMSQQDSEPSPRYRRRSSRSLSPRRTIATYSVPIDEYHSRRDGVYLERIPMVKYERLVYPDEYSPRRVSSRSQMPPPIPILYRESGIATEIRSSEGREARMMTPDAGVAQRHYMNDPMIIDDHRRYRERDYRSPADYQEQVMRGRPEHRYVKGPDFITREEVERHEAMRAQNSLPAQPQGL